jgi:hypothetical protein
LIGLRDASYARMCHSDHSGQINSIYFGSDQIWPVSEHHWKFSFVLGSLSPLPFVSGCLLVVKHYSFGSDFGSRSFSNSIHSERREAKEHIVAIIYVLPLFSLSQSAQLSKARHCLALSSNSLSCLLQAAYFLSYLWFGRAIANILSCPFAYGEILTSHL